MRYLLPLLFLLLPASPTAAEAPRLDAGLRLDGASDAWLSVWSPVLSGRASTPALEADVSYRVDILTGATPALVADGISSATRFDEVRHEVHAGLTRPLGGDAKVGLAYGLSVESDYTTHALSLTATLEALDRLATLSLGYDLSLETLGHAGDPSISEATTGHALSAVWTQILTRSTALTLQASVGYDRCGRRFGCYANPYRFVGVFGSERGPVLFSLHERHPDTALRGAGAVRLSQALGDFALHLGYRFYGDSWSVTGHTADLGLSWQAFSDRLVLKLEGRLTTQGAASFQSRRYLTDEDAPEVANYRTGDPALGGVRSFSLGLVADLEVGHLVGLPSFTLNLSLARFAASYPRSPLRRERATWLFGGGVRATF